MAKKNPLIYIPEGMLHEGEQIRPLNLLTKEGYVIDNNYFVTDQCRYFTISRGKFEEKTVTKTANGQFQVGVMTNQGQKHLSATRGMMATFCPVDNMYNKQVIHNDGNPDNNNIDNLHWGTYTESAIISAKSETRKPKGASIMTDDIIEIIIQYAIDGKSDEEISNLLPINTTPDTVRHVRGGYPPYDQALSRLGLQPVKQVTRKQISPEMRLAIRHDTAQGATKSQLVDKYGIAPDTARKYIEEFRREHKEVKHTGPLEKRSEKVKKTCPIIDARDNLLPGEEIIPVNIHTKYGCIIDPGYFASNLGNIYSVIRGGCKRLIPHPTQGGYLDVTLNTNQGPKHVMVHRLILCSFNPDPRMHEKEVDHIHGNKHDNRLSELRWAEDAKENMKFASEMGLLGHDTPQYASEHDIRLVHKLANEGLSDTEIANHPEMERKYSAGTIKHIRTGCGCYASLLKKYNLEPVRSRRTSFTEEEKKQIYDYIESHKDIDELMNVYKYAGQEFDASPDSIRRVYSDMRRKL